MGAYSAAGESSEDLIEPPLTLYDRQVVPFDDDIWADADLLAQRYAGLAHDSAALDQAFDRALRCNDVKRMALIGPRLAGTGPAARRRIPAAARALSRLGRHADALHLLESLGPPDPDDGDHVQAYAGALSGAGRFGDALVAIDAIAPRAPHRRGYKNFRSAVKRLLRASREAPGWRDALPVLRSFVVLGLDREAGRFMADILAAHPADGAGTFEERLSLAHAAIGVGAAREAFHFLASFAEEEKAQDRWRTLVLASSVLSGLEAPAGLEDYGRAGDKSARAWRALAAERAGAVEQAIGQLCQLCNEFKTDPSIRGALARCVGKSVIAQTRPSFRPGGAGRIVNLVTFFNEFELLRLHLEEMAPWVDAFVIVEAAKTFTGRDKPLHFEANRDLFKDFEDKIVHLPIRAFPEHLTSPWAREFYQRDMGIAAASGLCGEDDHILETDVDELIDGRALEGFESDFAFLDLRLSRYFLNYRPAPGGPSPTQMKSAILKARHLCRYGISYSRIVLGGWDERSHFLRDGGWHFTSVADAAGISLKVHSYSHQEQPKEKFLSVDYFDSVLGRIRAGHIEPGWRRVDLDDSFPASIRRQADALEGLLL